MGRNIHFCTNCQKNGKSTGVTSPEQTDFYAGYTCCFFQEKLSDKCPMCGKLGLIETNITEEELETIGKASNYNPQLLTAMRELKDKDIIEYELKMSQFRGNASTINASKQETPQPHIEPSIVCPRCGSSSITTGARGANGFWGFIGASKTVNRCAKCGHTWTPRA